MDTNTFKIEDSCCEMAPIDPDVIKDGCDQIEKALQWFAPEEQYQIIEKYKTLLLKDYYEALSETFEGSL